MLWEVWREALRTRVMAQSYPTTVLRALAGTRRRLRLQRALEAATTAGIVGLLAATATVYLSKAGALGSRGVWIGLTLAAALPALGALLAAARRLSDARVAKRIDRTHQLHDRLVTAVEFAALERATCFHAAQVRDAERCATRVVPSTAAPFRRPRDIGLLGLTLLCLVFVLLLKFPSTTVVAPKPPPLARLTIAPEDLEPHQALALELERQALEQDLPEVSELAKELNKLFEQIQKKELTRKELFAKLAELEKKYMDGLDGNFDDLLKKLKKMGGELQKEKLTKEAGNALKQADLDKAKKELEDLAKKVDRLKQEQKRRLARSLDRASRQKMEKDQLKRKLDQLNRQIRRLQRQLKQQKNNPAARRRLQRKQRQLQRLNRQQQQAAQQRRQLQRLNQQMKRAAQNLRNQLSPEAMKALQQAAQQMGRFANQRNKLRMMGKAQGQMVDLKELLRRLGKGGKGKQGKLKDFLARAKGLKPGQGKKGKGKKGLMLDPNGQGGTLIMPLPGPPGAGQDDPNGPPGDGIGDSSDPNLKGQATKLKARHKNLMVKGQESAGPTRSEVILGASEKGFATSHYRRVYREYTEIIEEVLKREEVPLGYKYYVKRYFQLIKPR